MEKTAKSGAVYYDYVRLACSVQMCVIYLSLLRVISRQGFGEQDRLLPPGVLEAGGGNAGTEQLVGGQAGTLQERFERLLAMGVAHLRLMAPGLIGQVANQNAS